MRKTLSFKNILYCVLSFLLIFDCDYIKPQSNNSYQDFVIEEKTNKNTEQLKISLESNLEISKEKIISILENKKNLFYLSKIEYETKLKIYKDTLHLMEIFQNDKDLDNFDFDEKDFILNKISEINRNIFKVDEGLEFFEEQKLQSFQKLVIVLKFDSINEEKVTYSKYSFYCPSKNTKNKLDLINKINNYEFLFEEDESQENNAFLRKHNIKLCKKFSK
tara:strand:- start:17 stop:676 length:660 start_codon:yes stop_codon:yes gene_type:complete